MCYRVAKDNMGEYIGNMYLVVEKHGADSEEVIDYIIKNRDSFSLYFDERMSIGTLIKKVKEENVNPVEYICSMM